MALQVIDSPKHHAENNHVLIYYLGAAGFLFKFPPASKLSINRGIPKLLQNDNLFRFAEGPTICIDPYLSDATERISGFPRLYPSPIQPEDLHFDILLLTHDHEDHLDPDSFDALMAANPGCRVFAPECCASLLNEKHREFELIAPGAMHSFGDVQVCTVGADHGSACPTAVGFVLEWPDDSNHSTPHRLYFTGDTSYTRSIIGPAIGLQPSMLIPCINGAFGNLNESEAALLALECHARFVIPSHYGLLDVHGGDARLFVHNLHRISPGTQVEILEPGFGMQVR